jgi:hypothetical protein
MSKGGTPTLRAARDRVLTLTNQASRRQRELASSRLRVRARIDRAVRKPSTLFGMFAAGLVLGLLPTPPLRRLRNGIDGLPGSLMSLALIAFRMQTMFGRARVAAKADETTDNRAEGSVLSGALPESGGY